MDGIMIQNSQDIRPSLAARGKGAAPRKALANIQNTHHTKSVTFDANTAPLKPGLKVSQLKGNRSTATPINKPLRRLAEKPSSSKKGFPSTTTPFKIFEDGGLQTQQPNKLVVQSSTKLKKKIDIFNDEIEYMPPCTDKADIELKMPKYLQKACLHKPQYNITIPNTVDEQTLRQMNERSKSEVLESTNKIFERLPKSIDEEEGDDNLNEFIEENFGKLCVMTDDDLFAQIESDESFSLESLDREIREAGLDPPSW